MTKEKRNVPFFNYPALFNAQKDDLMEIIHDVMSRGAFIMQKDLKEFETALAKYTGAKYAFGMADGTNAILLALRAAGVGPGDEVIVPSHTFIASVSPIVQLGAKPVLVECLPDHMVDPAAIERAITKKTKVILPVQLNGRTCNMEAIQKIADKHGLLIVEDAAQGLGSRFKGKMAGTFGLAGTYSFYPAKSLGSFGDSGALVTNDDKVAEKIELWRDHGRSAKTGDVEEWGTNCRLDNMQAAILNFKLKHFDKDVARRREIASMYDKRLKGIKQLTLPPAPDASPDYFDAYQNYEMEADHRDELKQHLEKEGVRTIIQWGGKAVHQFKALGFKDEFPITTRMTSRFIMLPLNTSLTNEDVSYVCDVIEEFYK